MSFIAKEVIKGFALKFTEQTADDMLKALDRAGYAVVPKEPTEKMHEAANREWDGRMSARSAGVWEAMLKASQ